MTAPVPVPPLYNPVKLTPAIEHNPAKIMMMVLPSLPQMVSVPFVNFRCTL